MIRVTRFISYYKLKLARLPASPHAIAAGFACGSMVSFTPLLGLHFLLAIVFAYIIRGNYVAALLGTIVGNPITFPFIWGLIYKVGAFVTSNKQKELNHEINIDLEVKNITHLNQIIAAMRLSEFVESVERGKD